MPGDSPRPPWTPPAALVSALARLLRATAARPSPKVRPAGKRKKLEMR
jgi:hypothetical protein